MNILITGGLGYIGGRVANYLKEKSPESSIFLTTRDKTRHLPSWTNKFTILQMDLLDEDSVSESIRNLNLDVIVHLAALNEIDSMKDPELAFKVNTKGTYKLLETAYRNNISKFIYFSTFHVYGEVTSSIITEETPTRPFHPYAITHRMAEDIVNYFKYYHGLKTLIFRLSNAYGYPMNKEVNRWTLVFNDLCKQAVTSGRLFLKSSGKQHRDFISLHDVARAVYHFLYLVIADNWGDGLYNLGGDCSMSIFNVALKVAEVYKSIYNKEILEIKTKSDNDYSDCKAVRFSIEKLKRKGFDLKGDMFFEIARTIKVCEQFTVYK